MGEGRVSNESAKRPIPKGEDGRSAVVGVVSCGCSSVRIYRFEG